MLKIFPTFIKVCQIESDLKYELKESCELLASLLRRLRIARITLKELMDKLTAKENISIVDLRQSMDLEAFPQMIPGGASFRHGRDRVTGSLVKKPGIL